MIKNIGILNRYIINTGRSWKLKDQRNGKMREKKQGTTQSIMLAVIPECCQRQHAVERIT